MNCFKLNISREITWAMLCLFLAATLACNKTELLNAKPSSNIVVPTTLGDFQSLLDNTNSSLSGDVMNVSPALGELSSGDYYIDNYADWNAIYSVKERNAYLWAADIYQGQGNDIDWNAPFQQIFYANVVLDGIVNIPVTPDNSRDWKNIRGSALFFRANALFNLAQVFTAPFDSVSAATDAGLPLRTSSNVTSKIGRSSVKDTYDQLLSDLKEAAQLLSATFPVNNRNRPSKAAAMALLSRVYLSMRDYHSEGIFADSSLQIYNKLIDYNTIDYTAFIPIAINNDETIFQSNINSTTSVVATLIFPYVVADSLLYKSYDPNDLRLKIFYTDNGSGLPMFNGTYNGFVYAFSGLATDEMYLNRAEYFARNGDTARAMNDLNTLLQNRWINGTFVRLSAVDQADALNKILTERRKELVWRGLRWIDLRRLNKEGANITLTRILNGQTYTLLPNSPLYTMPIPPDEIGLSGIAQNPR